MLKIKALTLIADGKTSFEYKLCESKGKNENRLEFRSPLEAAGRFATIY